MLRWFSTFLWVLRRPREAFESVRVDGWWSAALVVVYGGSGGLVLWLGISVPEGDAEFRKLLSALGMSFIGVGVFGGLSAVEYCGLRFIGSRHRWRIGHRVSATVVGHAAVAWPIAGALGGLAWNIGSALPDEWSSSFQDSRVWDQWIFGWLGPAHTHPKWAFTVLGLFAGTLVFEFLAYTGVRRCRWANVLP